VRVIVGGLGMSVGVLAMLMRRSCMLLGAFVLADIVKMGRLMVMMCRGVMVSGRLVMMLTRWMLRRLCHLQYLRGS
jgi:hypothetical protein